MYDLAELSMITINSGLQPCLGAERRKEQDFLRAEQGGRGAPSTTFCYQGNRLASKKIA